jgi:hypothetical protein
MLQEEGLTSVYRGGWFRSPSCRQPSHLSSLAASSPASLSPLDFWYTLHGTSPGHSYPGHSYPAMNQHQTTAEDDSALNAEGGGYRDVLGLMGHKQAIASFLLHPSRRLEILSRAVAASIGLQASSSPACSNHRVFVNHAVRSAAMPRSPCPTGRRVRAQPPRFLCPTAMPGAAVFACAR